MQPFILFNQTHLLTLLVTYGVIVFTIIWLRSKSKEIIIQAKISVGVLLLTHAVMQIFNAFSYQLAWQESIPLHMCDFSKIAIGLYLLGYGERLFHCAFFGALFLRQWL